MKTILATIVSMFLFVSFANAQAKSCADLIKGYDAAVKTAKLDAAATKKAGDQRKAAGCKEGCFCCLAVAVSSSTVQ